MSSSRHHDRSSSSSSSSSNNQHRNSKRSVTPRSPSPYRKSTGQPSNLSSFIPPRSAAAFPPPPPPLIPGNPSPETRLLILEGHLNAVAINSKLATEETTKRFTSLEHRLQQMQLRADQQDQRIEQLNQQCHQGMQQLAHTMAIVDGRISATSSDVEQHKIGLQSANNNLLLSMQHMSKVDAVMFVMSEHSRKLDEKLRACEHQRLKAEAVLRSQMADRATTTQGYNALVEAGMNRIPELGQRIAQNKKDLLIGMAARMKHDYSIDVIDEETGHMKTTLFPRPIHHHPVRTPTANERAAALSAKAEADEVRILEHRTHVVATQQ